MNEPVKTKPLVIFGAAHAFCLPIIGDINRAKPTGRSWAISTIRRSCGERRCGATFRCLAATV